MLTKIKSEAEILALRESGRLLAQVLRDVAQMAQPGISGKDIDRFAREEIKRLGGEPVLLGYQGFPATVCISSNHNVVHGIPGSKQFEKGELVGFDLCLKYRGMITDSALTVAVGGAKDAESQRLLDGTKEALSAGIHSIKGPTKVAVISRAVEAVLNRYKFGIVRSLVGHGVGHFVHEDPNIPNYFDGDEGMTLMPGMTIAIEPMATLGGDDVMLESDGWTVSTADGSLAAQFEHTVLITVDGAEILTKL